MAYINKPKIRQLSNSEKSEFVKKSHRLVYNTRKWRELRDGMLMTFPLCQQCGRDMAKEVHHRKPLSEARDDMEMVTLGFDPANLMCLCERCHDIIHRKENRYGSRQE